MNLKALFGIENNTEITALTQNSAEAGAGAVFFAVKGTKFDGNLFIDEVVKNGAAAVVSETPPSKSYPVPYLHVKNIDAAMADAALKFYNNPSKDMFVIGITGTKGKTSISYLLESIFNCANIPNSVIGTINYRINGKIISKAPNTTPAALSLYKMLAQMRGNGTKVLIMEVSSHALELKRVQGIEFDIALFTNLQRDHLDFHETFENYFNAKKKLFACLAKGKTAIINTDDKYGAELAEEFKDKLNIISVSLKEADHVKASLDGVTFRFKGADVKINLLGEHNIYNALLALRAAFEYGIDAETILAGLGTLEGIPGRMERVRAGQNFYAFIDFAYTVESLNSAYKVLLPYKKNRLITVFGCGGQRDTSKRPLMGGAACVNSERVYITNDNPRNESEENIFKDILAGVDGCDNYVLMPDRREAIFSAVAECREDDVLLVAGKGHEDYQILKDKTIHFSDKEVILEAIKTGLKKG